MVYTRTGHASNSNRSNHVCIPRTECSTICTVHLIKALEQETGCCTCYVQKRAKAHGSVYNSRLVVIMQYETVSREQQRVFFEITDGTRPPNPP